MIMSDGANKAHVTTDDVAHEAMRITIVSDETPMFQNVGTFYDLVDEIADKLLIHFSNADMHPSGADMEAIGMMGTRPPEKWPIAYRVYLTRLANAAKSHAEKDEGNVHIAPDTNSFAAIDSDTTVSFQQAVDPANALKDAITIHFPRVVLTHIFADTQMVVTPNAVMSGNAAFERLYGSASVYDKSANVVMSRQYTVALKIDTSGDITVVTTGSIIVSEVADGLSSTQFWIEADGGDVRMRVAGIDGSTLVWSLSMNIGLEILDEEILAQFP